MRIAMKLTIDGHSPIPIRRQLTEQLKHAIESGGVARDQALPSIRELAGFLGINANTVARVVEDLKQSGYVEARRGKRSEEHTSELQSHSDLVCRLLLEKKNPIRR